MAIAQVFIPFGEIIILLFWEFFTSVLADGFSLEVEWQQISLNLWDFSLYSGLSK